MSHLFLTDTQKKAKATLLLNVQTGTYKYKKQECLCGKTDFRMIAQRERHGLPITNVICRACGLVQAAEVLEDAHMADYYKNIYRELYNDNSGDKETLYKREYLSAKKMYNALKPFLKPQDLIVEVGCGAGGALGFFQRLGYQVMGCDYNAEYVDYAQMHNLNVHEGTLMDLHPKPVADIIIYSHVLEHIPNLTMELKTVSQKLKTNGLLLIEVPGLLNIENSYLSELQLYLQDAHIYNFSLGTLTSILSEHGFELVSGDENIRAVFRKTNTHSIKINHYPENDAYLNKLALKNNDLLFYYWNKARWFLLNLTRRWGLFDVSKYYYHKVRALFFS